MELITINQDNYSEVQFDIRQDPVRPELDLEFRFNPGRRVFALVENQEASTYKAAICVAFTNDVPTTVTELDLMSQDAVLDGKHGSIAVAYTVWSMAPRAGRGIVFRVLEECLNDIRIKRVITLSPKTDMARRFHLGNGATLVQENYETDNYEYRL
jgi:hypothetical protein